MKYSGSQLKARCILHELDHLEGIVFQDRSATELELERWVLEDEEGNISYLSPHTPTE